MRKLALSEKLCERLVAGGVIPEEGKALYRYGFSQLFVMALNLVTVAVIGVAMGMVWPCFVFVVAYVPLRRFVGGIHASTPLRCYVCSVLLLIAALRIIAVMPPLDALVLGGVAAGAILLWFLAPVEDPNKPFTAAERRHFRRVSRRLIVVESVAAIALLVCGFWVAAFGVTFVLWLLSAMVLLGIVKNALL